MILNRSHYLETAELSPLPDMHGAIHAWATCTFIVGSKSTWEKLTEVISEVGRRYYLLC